MYAASYRLAQRAARYCVERDNAYRTPLEAHYDAAATHYAQAACIASDAGLCDAGAAVTQTDDPGRYGAGAESDYLQLILAAVENNR